MTVAPVRYGIEIRCVGHLLAQLCMAAREYDVNVRWINSDQIFAVRVTSLGRSVTLSGETRVVRYFGRYALSVDDGSGMVGIMIFETQAELDAALAYWQPALKLSHWRITAKLSTCAEMGAAAKTNGHVFRSNTQLSAEIHILRHEDYYTNPRDPWMGGYDAEETLVHELIHCAMTNFEPDGEEPETKLKWNLCEQFVEQMARSFVDMKRA
jgi:hypothetical protein